MKLILLEDLTAAKLGLDPALGLLHCKGETLDDCLPEVGAKLIREGIAAPLEQQQKSRAAPPQNKRAAGGRENKRR